MSAPNRGSSDGKDEYVPFYPPEPKSLSDHIKDQPLVALGGLALIGILVGGMWSIKAGRSDIGNKLMQARVATQIAVVALLSFGAGAAAYKTLKRDLPPLPGNK